MQRLKCPNIVMLVNDHQAFYGHSRVRRPNFMKLADEGVMFERTYCSSPLCCPSRKTMLTGKMPSRHGQLENAVKTSVDSDTTYYDYLREAGYDLYYYGKWHASDGIPADLGCRGVSYPDYSNPYRQSEYKAYVGRKGIAPARMLVEHNLWKDSLLPNVKPGSVYDFPGVMTNEALSGLLLTEKESHEAFYLADLACRQLEILANQNGGDRPFCLRVDFWGPHQPYHPTPEFANMYPPKDIPEYTSFKDTLEHKPDSYFFETGANISNNYRLNIPNPMPWSQWQQILSRCYGQISLIDEAGGLILDCIKDLGLDENTLVLWTADHGDALGCHGGHFDKACYMPEEVMRIPLAVKYPPLIPTKTVSQALVSNADIAPSLLDAAGLSFREKIDGRSFLDLFNNGSAPWRTIVTAETNGHLAPWFGRMAVDQRYKFIYNKGDINELYDLETDPWELNNRIDDDTYTELINGFKAALRLER